MYFSVLSCFIWIYYVINVYYVNVSYAICIEVYGKILPRVYITICFADSARTLSLLWRKVYSLRWYNIVSLCKWIMSVIYSFSLFTIYTIYISLHYNCVFFMLFASLLHPNVCYYTDTMLLQCIYKYIIIIMNVIYSFYYSLYGHILFIYH